MFFRLLLLFTVVPLIELYLLIRVGAIIGALPTILIVLGTGALGAFLARRQGFQVWVRIQGSLQQGRFPAKELIDGLLVLAAGLLLITPGIMTDVLGFLLLFPVTRTFFRRALMRRFSGMVRQGPTGFSAEFRSEPRSVRDVTDTGEGDRE